MVGNVLLTSLPSACVCRCFLSRPGRLKLLGQRGQRCGFPPVCSRSWSLKEDAVEKKEEPMEKKEEPMENKEDPVEKKEDPAEKIGDLLEKLEDLLAKKEDPLKKMEDAVEKKGAVEIRRTR